MKCLHRSAGLDGGIDRFRIGCSLAKRKGAYAIRGALQRMRDLAPGYDVRSFERSFEAFHHCRSLSRKQFEHFGIKPGFAASVTGEMGKIDQ
jgi:hypothetical protein